MIGRATQSHQVSDLLGTQAPQLRRLVRYLLVMSLVDSGKARIIQARATKADHYLTIERASGDVFEILRPPISMADELQLREQVKRILEVHDD